MHAHARRAAFRFFSISHQLSSRHHLCSQRHQGHGFPTKGPPLILRARIALHAAGYQRFDTVRLWLRPSERNPRGFSPASLAGPRSQRCGPRSAALPEQHQADHSPNESVPLCLGYRDSLHRLVRFWLAPSPFLTSQHEFPARALAYALSLTDHGCCSGSGVPAQRAGLRPEDVFVPKKSGQACREAAVWYLAMACVLSALSPPV